MSGHSKWSTIKRQKGAADAKRGQMFTKLSNAITIAIRQGAGIADPDSNFKLRLAIDKARSANMPKENIERAMDRAKGADESEVEELTFEGFGPHGVAMLIEAVTDNKQRTFSNVKNAFEKNGGAMGAPGSVSYLFKKRGEIIVRKNGFSLEDLLEKGINAGVEDMEEEQNLVCFWTDPQNLQKVKNVLEQDGLQIESTKLILLPTSCVKLDEEKKRQVLNLAESLEALDDIQAVWTNLS